MTPEVKFATPEPSFFDLRGHRFLLAFKRIWRAGGAGCRASWNSVGEKVMLDPQTLADRYVAVWNEKDEERRRDAIAALWVPDGQHFVAAREAQGYDDLEKRIRGSHEKNVRDDGNRFRAAPAVCAMSLRSIGRCCRPTPTQSWSGG